MKLDDFMFVVWCVLSGVALFFMILRKFGLSLGFNLCALLIALGGFAGFYK